MAKIHIIFNDAALVEIKRRASLKNKPLPDDFIGPEFDDAEMGQSSIQGFIAVQPIGAHTAYLYNSQQISRIKVVEEPEQETESGIVIVKRDTDIKTL